MGRYVKSKEGLDEHLNRILGDELIKIGSEDELMDYIGKDIADKINSHGKGLFEFNIKVQKVNIPDQVYDQIDEGKMEFLYWEIAGTYVEELSDTIKTKYHWVSDVYQEGRSGGWLCLDASKKISDIYTDLNELVMLMDQDEVGEDDLETARKAKSKVNAMVSDLQDIKEAVKTTLRDFKADMESAEFWEQYEKEEE